jgi:hypothetical protein
MSSRSDDLDVRLDEVARRAAEGDRDALTDVVREIQHPMYRLALRFLGNPDDAQDACQEILIRIVTRLGTFEGARSSRPGRTRSRSARSCGRGSGSTSRRC